MAEAAAVVVGAIIGVAGSVYSSNQAEESANKAYVAQQKQWEAEAQMASQNAFASAEAIWATAGSQAAAIQAQAGMERDLFYKEAESARSIAYANIEAMKQEGAESVRRLQGQQAALEDKTRALAGASGVRMDGSIKLNQDGFEQENKNQLNWLQTSLTSKANNATYEAEELYTMYRTKADTAYAVAGVTAGALIEQAGYSASSLQQQGHALAHKGSGLTQDDEDNIAFIQADMAANGLSK